MRRRRKGKFGNGFGRLLTALLVLPSLYLAAALGGSLVPVNRSWSEPAEGTTIYIADNGIHADIIMPVTAQGLDWGRFIRKEDFAAVPPGTQWIAFGSGEKRVYLETPSWWDIKPKTVWSALAGGERVMHVEYVPSPYYAAREVRLRPEEYRSLWAAVRADFKLGRNGLPQRLDHRGYGPADAFYGATGKANMLHTCNVIAARWLRLAGVRTSLWPPFVNGLTFRYRRAAE